MSDFTHWFFCRINRHANYGRRARYSDVMPTISGSAPRVGAESFSAFFAAVTRRGEVHHHIRRGGALPAARHRRVQVREWVHDLAQGDEERCRGKGRGATFLRAKVISGGASREEDDETGRTDDTEAELVVADSTETTSETLSEVNAGGSWGAAAAKSLECLY
ncbi:hypothetical protein B0H11DRAFT_1923288 [Mycena galericulata]|nr:hypothetical protein B0H11DRAFT_1923288 [Mycena galericulata]